MSPPGPLPPGAESVLDSVRWPPRALAAGTCQPATHHAARLQALPGRGTTELTSVSSISSCQLEFLLLGPYTQSWKALHTSHTGDNTFYQQRDGGADFRPPSLWGPSRVEPQVRPYPITPTIPTSTPSFPWQASVHVSGHPGSHCLFLGAKAPLWVERKWGHYE